MSCGVDDCPSTASSYESLRQHLYKKHRNALYLPEIITEVEPENNLLLSCEETLEAPPTELSQLDIDHLAAGAACRPSSCELEAAKYILKVRDGKGLTQVVTDGIMRDIDTLISCATESLEKKVIAKLAECHNCPTVK